MMALLKAGVPVNVVVPQRKPRAADMGRCVNVHLALEHGARSSASSGESGSGKDDIGNAPGQICAHDRPRLAGAGRPVIGVRAAVDPWPGLDRSRMRGSDRAENSRLVACRAA